MSLFRKQPSNGAVSDSLSRTPSGKEPPKEFVSADAKKPEEAVAVAAPQSVGWFAGLALSVSQLFTGSTTQALVVAEEEEKKGRKMSHEVPVDEEEYEENAESIQGSDPSQNAGVLKEQVRMHAGNSLRKKILFTEKQGATTPHGAKDSLINAQSYNQIESGSDQDNSSGSPAKDRGKPDANQISYTTSLKGGNTPHDSKVRSDLKMNTSLIQQKRPHSSSVGDKLHQIGSSFSYLASSLLYREAEPALSPQPKPVQDASKAEEENSGLGVLGRFFDRVTKANNNNNNPSITIRKMENRVSVDEFMAPAYLDDRSPTISGARLFSNFLQDDGATPQKRTQGRQHSKTQHVEARPLLVGSRANEPASQPEEKLRQIDNIVFNQDKSHFAVIWTDGGFSKFDVATLQIILRVQQAPKAGTQQPQEDTSDEITVSNTNLPRSLGNMRISSRVFRKSAPEGEVQDDEADFLCDDFEDSTVPEVDQFACLALQHRTNDYLATLVRDPKMMIYVHIQDTMPRQQTSKRHRQTVKPQVGKRTHVKHFLEEVSRIEILPDARFTLVCLKTAIYIYTKNSQDLYDIVPCSNSPLSSAIFKSYDQKLVLAYLSRSDPGETIEVHDYAPNVWTGKETLFTIAKPFSSGYKVGGLQLDELGRRIVAVSADGCYIYLFSLDEAASDEQLGQDQAKPEYGAEDQRQDAKPAVRHTQVSIKTPQQSFVRSSSSCKQIYLPIQIVEGYTMQNHMCDFIILSSSSMTTHMFVLKTDVELEEQKQQQQASGWTFSRFLPSSFTLDRSKIRLNIQEELAPVEPPSYRQNGRTQLPVVPEHTGQNVNKREQQEYPYTSFIEPSGLLVVISHSGYCCKFSIELQNEQSQIDQQNSGAYNTTRPPRFNAQLREKSISLSQASLSYSLAQLKDLGPRTSKNQFGRQSNALSPTKSLAIDTVLSKQLAESSAPSRSNTLQESRQPTAPRNQELSGGAASLSQSATKKTTAFSGYKQPTLRLKFKITDFFVKIDNKAESLKRIRKRALIELRTEEFKEFLWQMHQSQTQDRQQLLNKAHDPIKGSNLSKLLRGN